MKKLDEDHDLYVFNAGNARHAKSMVARFNRWTERYSEDRRLNGTYSAEQRGEKVCIIKSIDSCTGWYQTLPSIEKLDAQPINTFDDILKHLAIAELIAAVMESPLEKKIKTEITEILKMNEKVLDKTKG